MDPVRLACWVYGGKLHLVTTGAAVWMPWAAELTPATVADNEQALRLLAALPSTLHGLWGDTSYNDPARHAACAAVACRLVTPQRGPYPPTDDGQAGRRVFHHRRAHAIEPFNGQFKGIVECLGQVPTRGLLATQRYVLGAVFGYQLTLLYRAQAGADLRVGLKAFLRAAC